MSPNKIINVWLCLPSLEETSYGPLLTLSLSGFESFVLFILEGCDKDIAVKI